MAFAFLKRNTLNYEITMITRLKQLLNDYKSFTSQALNC